MRAFVVTARAAASLFGLVGRILRTLRSLWGHASGLRVRRLFALNGLLLVVGGLGLCARAYVVQASNGCNDMTTWRDFARVIHAHGLGYIYESDPTFNHPPLMGLMAGYLDGLAQRSGLRFEVLFKAPSVLADVLSATLIYRFVRRTSARLAALAFALFCWSPVSILITAYHGNTDSICAALALLAASLVDDGQPLLGGLALGASMNVKLIPLIVIPLLASCLGDRRRFMRFFAGLSIGALPFVPIVIGHSHSFYAHALAYRSNQYKWGITGILYELAEAPRMANIANAINFLWIRVGATAILLSSLALAAANLPRPRWSARELTACAFGVFLILAPGFGVQYLAYLLPVLFAVRVGRAAVYSAVAGAYALLMYFTSWTGDQPFYSFIPPRSPSGVQAVGYLAWVVVICAVVDLLGLSRSFESWNRSRARLRAYNPSRPREVGLSDAWLAIREWFTAKRIERADLALTEDQRTSVRVEYATAMGFWSATGSCARSHRAATVLSLHREANLRFIRAFLLSMDGSENVGSLTPGAAFDRMEAAVRQHPSLPTPLTLHTLRRLQLASEPLELDRLSKEDDDRAGEIMEAGTRWLSSLVDARTPREVKTGRVVCVTVASVLAVWLATVALRPTSVAEKKPATSSSTAYGAPASGAVDGDKNAPFGFHSEDEPFPWLAVDLERRYEITKVKVYGRGDGPFDQSIPLALEVSDDGASFRKIAERAEPFSQADPWVIATNALVARFVRLRTERRSVLVLSEVEVYGQPSK